MRSTYLKFRIILESMGMLKECCLCVVVLVVVVVAFVVFVFVLVVDLS